jgi:hypothetical protein
LLLFARDLIAIKWIKTEQRHTQKFKRVYFPIEKLEAIFLCVPEKIRIRRTSDTKKRVEKHLENIWGKDVVENLLKVCSNSHFSDYKLNPIEGEWASQNKLVLISIGNNS